MSSDDEIGDAECGRILGILESTEATGTLTVWESEFCDSVSAHLAEWGGRSYVSGKQMAIIERLAEKL